MGIYKKFRNYQFQNCLKMKIQFNLSFWLITLSILFFHSCSNNNSSTSSIAGDQVLLTINEENITAKQFKKEFERQKKIFRVQSNQKLKPEELIWIKTRVIDEIVQNTLFEQEVRENNISVSQEEFEEALSKARTGYQEDVLEKVLALEDISLENWQNSIKNKLLINKLIHQQVNSKVAISDEALRSYFEINSEKFHKNEQVKALHIMVETEEEIRQIQKELQNKQNFFSALAKEYSLGPEGAEGGDLGYFEAGQMPEEFDDVFKLKIDKISDIIRTPYGFHLFKVVDKIPERKMNFEESKKKIAKVLLHDLQDKAFQKWFLKLKENADIKINYDSLEKII